MHINFLSTYSPLWLFPLFLFSLAVSLFLYYKDKKLADLPVWNILLMATLRFIGIFLIGIFLISPLIRYLHIQFEKPLLLVAQDNSESVFMLQKNADDKLKYTHAFDSLLFKLNSRFNLHTLSFGDHISDTIDFKFDYKETDFSQLFDEIKKRYENENIGALIVSSDGIFNKGINPVYYSDKINFPVYTIALGDTSRQRDIALTKILTNPMVLLGNEFPLEVYIRSYGFSGNTVKISIFNKNKLVVSKDILINSNDYFSIKKFYIKAQKKGLQKYSIRITKLNEEINLHNNSKNFLIDVLDDQKKVLILASAVHPDIGAIKEALSNKNTLQVKVSTLDKFKDNLMDYQLIIFYQIPTTKFSGQKEIEAIKKAKIPALFILGAKSDIQKFNLLVKGCKIEKNKNNFDNATAILNKAFNLFEAKDILKNIEDYPPLMAPFGIYSYTRDAQVLLFQKIDGIPTDKPLILFIKSVQNQTKMAFIFGEGLWKWRMNDYRINGNHEQFDMLINKITRFLILNVQKSRFNVIAKQLYKENEEIEFKADFYNRSYELNNDKDIFLEILNQQGRRLKYVFSKYGKSYKINIGSLPLGTYQYVAQTEREGKVFKNAGSIIVSPVDIEKENTRANHLVLHQLAANTGGKMFNISQLNDLFNSLEADNHLKPIAHEKEEIVDWIEAKYLFFIIVIFLAMEWFWRKISGTV